MDESIDIIGEANNFTKLSEYYGYWKLPVRKIEQNKAEFSCHEGLFEFKLMPFGFMNDPSSFQRC